jgi:hypothetical protein
MMEDNNANFTFSWALDLIKQGYEVTRRSWDEEDKSISIKPEVTCNGYEIGAHIMLKTSGGGAIPWTPSQEDILAEDYYKSSINDSCKFTKKDLIHCFSKVNKEGSAVCIPYLPVVELLSAYKELTNKCFEYELIDNDDVIDYALLGFEENHYILTWSPIMGAYKLVKKFN